MNLVDQLLARRHITLPSGPSLDECRRRIGEDTGVTSPWGRGGHGDGPFLVSWRGPDEVRLMKPFPPMSRRRTAKATLLARFIPDANGTDVEVTTGMMVGNLVSYAGLWAFLLFVALANLSYMMSGGPKSEIGIAFAVFAMPLIYLSNRASVARQSVDLLADFENALETPVFDSPSV